MLMMVFVIDVDVVPFAFGVYFFCRLRDERFMFLIFPHFLLFRKKVFVYCGWARVVVKVCDEINAQMRLFLMSHKINR